MDSIVLLLSLVSSAAYFQDVSTFLLQGPCPVRPPCYCSGDTLYCSGRDLTSVPKFYPSNLKLPYLRIFLSSNRLRTIPANAFLNLHQQKGSFIKVDLSDNIISHIDENAFTGIENEVGFLDLEDNDLQSLPRAIAKLTNLQNLYILDNQLTSLDPYVVNGISHSLRTLEVSLHHYSSWPKELSIFKSLENVNIKIHDFRMPDDAFAGSENTLKRLYIEDSFYDYISPAVCRLNSLENLAFDFDHSDHDGNYNAYKNTTFREDFIPCNITTLRSLSLEDTFSFTSKLFNQFPLLKVFKLESPEHNKFDNRYIPLNSQLTNIHLKDCGYTSVPGAVNIFSHLEELDLRDNDIETISEFDLTGLANLITLSLEDNPVRYISPTAFARNSNIQVLNLVSTYIAAIPVAITTLQSLQTLNVEDTRVTCDCNSLSNVTSWNIQGITITGLCDESDPENSDMIKTYMATTLHSCP